MEVRLAEIEARLAVIEERARPKPVPEGAGLRVADDVLAYINGGGAAVTPKYSWRFRLRLFLRRLVALEPAEHDVGGLGR